MKPLIYDAAPILGLGAPSNEPLPEPEPGEVVIRVGAWSLHDLCTCETVVRHNLMWNQNWYHAYPCCRTRLTPGIYRVRSRIAGSNYQGFPEQKSLLLPGEEVAPVALVAATLLCHIKQTSQDLLYADWCRCAETLPDELCVGLTVLRGRVYVYYCWNGDRGDNLWLAGCRKA